MVRSYWNDDYFDQIMKWKHAALVRVRMVGGRKDLNTVGPAVRHLDHIHLSTCAVPLPYVRHICAGHRHTMYPACSILVLRGFGVNTAGLIEATYVTWLALQLSRIVQRCSRPSASYVNLVVGCKKLALIPLAFPSMLEDRPHYLREGSSPTTSDSANPVCCRRLWDHSYCLLISVEASY